jgi:hypothetical protein
MPHIGTLVVGSGHMYMRWLNWEAQGGDGKARVLDAVPHTQFTKLVSRTTKVNDSSKRTFLTELIWKQE